MTTTTKLWAYPARVDEVEPGDWTAAFSDFPEALGGGSTFEEAMTDAEGALDECVLHYLAQGRLLPPLRAPQAGEHLVPLDVLTAARAELAMRMRAVRLSNAALARELGKSEGAVRRLVDGSTGVKIGTVLEALNLVQTDGANAPRLRPVLGMVAD